jgi:hypothetical protein
MEQELRGKYHGKSLSVNKNRRFTRLSITNETIDWLIMPSSGVTLLKNYAQTQIHTSHNSNLTLSNVTPDNGQGRREDLWGPVEKIALGALDAIQLPGTLEA